MSTTELVFSAVSIAVTVCLFVAYNFWTLNKKLDDLFEDRTSKTNALKTILEHEFEKLNINITNGYNNLANSTKRVNSKLGKLLDRK